MCAPPARQPWGLSFLSLPKKISSLFIISYTYIHKGDKFRGMRTDIVLLNTYHTNPVQNDADPWSPLTVHRQLTRLRFVLCGDINNTPEGHQPLSPNIELLGELEIGTIFSALHFRVDWANYKPPQKQSTSVASCCMNYTHAYDKLLLLFSGSGSQFQTVSGLLLNRRKVLIVGMLVGE